MASDLFDNSFFSDLISPFNDSPIDLHHDIFQTFQYYLNSSSNNNIINQENSFDGASDTLDQIASELLSSSPPSHQLGNLSLCHDFPNAPSTNFSALEVKTEEFQPSFDAISGFNDSFLPHSPRDNAARLMQRRFSINSFDAKPTFHFQPHLDSVLESPNFQPQVLSSPETNFSSCQIRRVCSTGDLQKIETTQTGNVLSSSPLSTEGSFMEEQNPRVGRYSAEERKERIHRYRAKRTQRNFNKTIKYACRKTLADNRPRIRGRFARNDEAVEIPKAANRYDDEDDLWIDGYHEEDEEGSAGRGYNQFRSKTAAQYQCYSQW